MRKFHMKPILYSLIATFLPAEFMMNVQAAEMTADEVMLQYDRRDDGASAVADYTMVLIDRRDRQRTRNLRVYSKDYGLDSKTLSLFDSPADIQGTAYLNFDWNDENVDDDSWLYLPALQQVKRIASSDTSDSFLGSDFTYADINGVEYNWYNYRFINTSEIIDGQDCWVIEVTPKPEFKVKAETATGYAKSQVWISKDSFLQLRGQVWELRGNRVKYLTASDIEQIDGIWTVKRLQVVTTRNERQEHASILQVDRVRYNVELNDTIFTTETMQRGLD